MRKNYAVSAKEIADQSDFNENNQIFSLDLKELLKGNNDILGKNKEKILLTQVKNVQNKERKVSNINGKEVKINKIDLNSLSKNPPLPLNKTQTKAISEATSTRGDKGKISSNLDSKNLNCQNSSCESRKICPTNCKIKLNFERSPASFMGKDEEVKYVKLPSQNSTEYLTKNIASQNNNKNYKAKISYKRPKTSTNTRLFSMHNHLNSNILSPNLTLTSKVLNSTNFNKISPLFFSLGTFPPKKKISVNNKVLFLSKNLTTRDDFKEKNFLNNFIVEDERVLGRVIIELTKSNFNNKYQICYKTKDRREREEVKEFFNSIRYRPDSELSLNFTRYFSRMSQKSPNKHKKKKKVFCLFRQEKTPTLKIKAFTFKKVTQPLYLKFRDFGGNLTAEEEKKNEEFDFCGKIKGRKVRVGALNSAKRPSTAKI